MAKQKKHPPLFVEFTAVTGVAPQAWRVCAMWKRKPVACSMTFGRKADAERALRALIEAGYDTPQKLVDLKPEDRNRIMAEAMAW